MAVEISKIDAIIDRHGVEQRGLILSLLEIQDEFHYLPPDAMQRVAARLDIPMIQVHQVAEFYKAFSLKPRGKHIIKVCRGTACHVRGGDVLVDQIGRLLDIEPGETSQDMQFTLDPVNCLGCCALGQVMVIDDKYYGNMTNSKVEHVLNKYKEREASAHG